ncbi:MAG: trigger factor [Verrucomicrobiota bacterium]|nr:trigger factor [Verrucomicrobiota bacterium]
MNVTTTDISDTRKQLIVSFTADETTAEDRKLFKDLAKQAQFPGFRPGKAPEHMIRKRYAKELTGEIARALVNKAYEEGVKNTALPVISVVKVEGTDNVVPGTEQTITFTLDIRPSFDLPVYKGIVTDVVTTDVSDAEVEAAVENLRKQRSEFKVVEHEAKVGDYVRVTYRGTIDGKLIAEIAPKEAIWGTQENTWEEAGTPAETMVGVPEIIDGIVGMKKGETKEVSHTFPADFANTDLAGKQAVYTIEVIEVRERVMPELNAEFLKHYKAETVEQLRSNLMDDIIARKEQERYSEQRKQITAKLGAAVDFPLPESIVESVHQDIMRDIMDRNMKQGVSVEEFEKHKDEFYHQTKRLAYQRAKIDLVLARIADEEKITVTQEDFARAVYAEAIRLRVRPEEVVKSIQKDKERMNAMRDQLLIGKTLDYLCKEATVNVVQSVPVSA